MDKDKLLRLYLDGDLSPEEECRALHTIADDAEMRDMLRFEQKLSDTFPSQQRSTEFPEVPADFSDKVMHRIQELELNTEEETISGKIHQWFEQLFRPQQIIWRPAYGLVMVLLVLFALGYPLFMMDSEVSNIPEQSTTQSVGESVQQVSTGAEEVMLRFVYFDDNANSVSVAGDFSDWEPIELSKQTVNGEEVWTGLVSMSRGEHHYMFVRNGREWVTDPLAPIHRDDGFGNKNAVVYL